MIRCGPPLRLRTRALGLAGVVPWTTLLWSPDSRWLAFSRMFGAGTSIWRVDVESGIVQQVTRPDR